jgi:type II secretory pathway component PulC
MGGVGEQLNMQLVSGKNAGTESGARARVAALSAQALRSGPRLAEVLLAAAIVAQVSFTCKTVVGLSYGNKAARSASLIPTHRPTDLDLAALGQLFGTSPKAATGVGQAQAQALVLTGVIALSDPAAGFGILGATREHTALYRAGTDLPGGGRLTAVYHDSVEIEVEGMRQLVRLPRPVAQGKAIAAVDAAAPPESVVAEETPGTVKPTTPGEDWLARHVMAEATDPSGRPIGLSLSGGSKKNGLRFGDVLTAINGIPVPDRKTAVDLLSQASGPLQGGAQQLAQLTVLRNGNPISVPLRPEL